MELESRAGDLPGNCDPYLRLVYDHIDAALFVMEVVDGKDFRFLGLNPAHERLTGLRSEDVRGKRPSEFLPPAMAEAVSANYRRCLEAGTTIEYEEVLPFQGRDSWWRTRLIPVPGADGSVATIIGASIHITELRQSERQAHAERRFQETLLETIPFPVFYTDSRLTLLGRNESAARQFGIGPDWEDSGRADRTMDAESSIELAASLRRCVDSMEPAVATIRLRRVDGNERIVEVHQSAFSGEEPGSRGVVAVILDITERLKTEEALKALAINDELTGLLNRRGYTQLANREWKKVCRLESAISVIMLDIDHFKGYNDRYGHQAGDQALRAVAGCLQSAVQRPSDLACRYGGEEFLVVLPATDRAGALTVATRIRDRVAELALEHAASPVAPVLTVSMGVATAITSHGAACGDLSLEALVGDADLRLYRAKQDGRNRIVPD